MKYQHSWIQTYSGRAFNPLEPDPDLINIVDIAWALSNQCRYSGHTKRFYSVAEHSVLVSRSVDPENALWGLLHDASEAYLSDIPAPLKPFLQNYKVWEEKLMEIIINKFGLTPDQPDQVSEHDQRILQNERQVLMNPCDREWGLTCKPLPGVQVIGLAPGIANKIFLHRFYELTRQTNEKLSATY